MSLLLDEVEVVLEGDYPTDTMQHIRTDPQALWREIDEEVEKFLAEAKPRLQRLHQRPSLKDSTEVSSSEIDCEEDQSVHGRIPVWVFVESHGDGDKNLPAVRSFVHLYRSCPCSEPIP